VNNTKISHKTSVYLRKKKVLELLGYEVTQLEREGKTCGMMSSEAKHTTT